MNFLKDLFGHALVIGLVGFLLKNAFGAAPPPPPVRTGDPLFAALKRGIRMMKGYIHDRDR